MCPVKLWTFQRQVWTWTFRWQLLQNVKSFRTRAESTPFPTRLLNQSCPWALTSLYWLTPREISLCQSNCHCDWCHVHGQLLTPEWNVLTAWHAASYLSWQGTCNTNVWIVLINGFESRRDRTLFKCRSILHKLRLLVNYWSADCQQSSLED